MTSQSSENENKSKSVFVRLFDPLGPLEGVMACTDPLSSSSIGLSF